MTKRPRKRLDRRDKFVMLPHWLLTSRAWRALPHPAKSLYLEGFELRYTGCNNGDVELGEREAADIIGSTGRGQCSQKFAGKMLDRLEVAGFIRPAMKGRFHSKRHRTRWILTRYEHLGHKPTMDFMRPRQVPKFESQRSPGPLTEVPRTSRNAEIAATEVPRTSIRPESTPSIEVPRTSVLVYQGRFLSCAPSGTRAERAAWLRTWLDSGRVTPEAVACALALDPPHVDEIAAGKVELARGSWDRLAALVRGRLH